MNKTNIIQLIKDIHSHSHATPVIWPLSVSHHGESTILVDKVGRWATGQVHPASEAEVICKELNRRAGEVQS